MPMYLDDGDDSLVMQLVLIYVVCTGNARGLENVVFAIGLAVSSQSVYKLKIMLDADVLG